jgi:neurotransmitter:Na+ symporter, NSS family
MAKRTSLHGFWSTRLAFILAAAGSAVGLGNIWRFPYIVGENGGGAFVLVYLICVLAIGVPIMMSEIMLGRRGRRSPINTMRLLSEEESGSRYWQLVGWMGVIAGFLILSFYSVIAGASLHYTSLSLQATFSGIDAAGTGALWDRFTASWQWMLFWHTVFLGLTVFVVARGVQRGLEQLVRLLMPLLLTLLLVMVGYGLFQADFAQGFNYLFKPDFSELSANAILIAIGQAFFTLSLGMGAIMAYGAYLPEDVSIGRTAFSVVAADTVVALLAGLAIFPIVFGFGISPDEGPGLVFHSLPIAFGQMPGGLFFGTLFFLLLVFAAWTSSISLMEPAVAWVVENKGLSRAAATLGVGGIIWFLGIGTVLSFNLWSEITFLAGTIFHNVEMLTQNILLPLGGFLIAVFAGWVMSRASTSEELDLGVGVRYKAWLFFIRFVAPLAVILAFLHALGVFDRFQTEEPVAGLPVIEQVLTEQVRDHRAHS